MIINLIIIIIIQFANTHFKLFIYLFDAQNTLQHSKITAGQQDMS